MSTGFIDVGCGCGGATQGAIQAGCTVLFAEDISLESLKTYKLNHPHIPVFNTAEDAAPLEPLLQDTDVDKIVVFVSPYAPDISALAYTVWLNGILKIPFVVIKECLRTADARIFADETPVVQLTLNYGDLGVPQDRIRTLGFYSKYDVSLDNFTDYLKYSVVADWIQLAQGVDDVGAPVVNSRHQIALYNRAPPLNTKFSRSSAGFVHPAMHRCINLSEGLALQTFSPSYRFNCGLNEATRQIGRATPPIVVEKIVKMLGLVEGKLNEKIQ